MNKNADEYMKQHPGEWFTRAQVTGMVEQHAKDWEQQAILLKNMVKEAV